MVPSKRNKLLGIFLLFLFFGCTLTSLVLAENRDGSTSINDDPQHTVVHNLEDIVNNEIESGNYEVMNYQGNNKLLIVDYTTQLEQNMAIDRISTFVEHATYHGTIITTTPDQSNYQGANFAGHDIKGSDFARFYSIANQQSISLTQQEEQLRNTLVSSNIISANADGSYSATEGTALVTVNHDDSLSSYRETIASHELQHGLDFTDATHWQDTQTRWNTLSSGQQNAFEKFLQNQGEYNPDNQDLVITEFGAYARTTGNTDFNGFIDEQVNSGILNTEEGNILKSTGIETGFWTTSPAPVQPSTAPVETDIIAEVGGEQEVDGGTEDETTEPEQLEEATPEDTNEEPEEETIEPEPPEEDVVEETEEAHTETPEQDVGSSQGEEDTLPESEDDAACFLPSTNITLSNGSKKQIQYIQIGDNVLSYDFDNDKLVESNVTNIFSHLDYNYLIINDKIKVTPYHMVYAKKNK